MVIDAVSKCVYGKLIYISVPEGITILVDEDEPVARITLATRVEEEEEEEVPIEIAADEVEVIAKGKAEEEKEEEEAGTEE